MKDIKHIRQDFHLAAWVMPQGWDLGVPWGVLGGQFFFPQIQPDLVCGLGEGPKGQISLNLNNKVKFKAF